MKLLGSIYKKKEIHNMKYINDVNKIVREVINANKNIF